MRTGRIALPRGRSLDLSKAPLIMGIVNRTPDSFYEASRSGGAEEALKAAMAMIDEGADIIDVGGESSRPGAAYVSADEEMSRIVPFIGLVRQESDIPVSVDTRKAEVAEAALAAGADIINDISALEDDPGLGPLAARSGAALVLMHKKGSPLTMQASPSYADAVAEIRDYLASRAEAAMACGVDRNSIVLDPGIGFGKRVEDNLDILKHLAEITSLGYPVLIGLSRKSFLGAVTGRETADRLHATTAAHAIAALAGADILRVHDAAAARDAVAIVRAVTARP